MGTLLHLFSLLLIFPFSFSNSRFISLEAVSISVIPAISFFILGFWLKSETYMFCCFNFLISFLWKYLDTLQNLPSKYTILNFIIHLMLSQTIELYNNNENQYLVHNFVYHASGCLFLCRSNQYKCPDMRAELHKPLLCRIRQWLYGNALLVVTLSTVVSDKQ